MKRCVTEGDIEGSHKEDSYTFVRNKNKIVKADILMKTTKQNIPLCPIHHLPPLERRSLPQENLHSELLVGAGGLVDVLNLSIKPEAPLVWRLHVVVDQHLHAHLELVPPQQGPGTWPHIHRSHLHHTILWVTGGRNKKRDKERG